MFACVYHIQSFASIIQIQFSSAAGTGRLMAILSHRAGCVCVWNWTETFWNISHSLARVLLFFAAVHCQNCYMENCCKWEERTWCYWRSSLILHLTHNRVNSFERVGGVNAVSFDMITTQIVNDQLLLHQYSRCCGKWKFQGPQLWNTMKLFTAVCL